MSCVDGGKSQVIQRTAEAADELYRVRDTYFPKEPDEKISKLQSLADAALCLLDSVPPEEVKQSDLSFVFHLQIKFILNLSFISNRVFIRTTNMEDQASKRIAVMTGASKGIRLEIVKQLASNGIMVLFTARDVKRGTEAVKKLKDLGFSDVVFHQLDVSDTASIGSLADFIKIEFEKLDILVDMRDFLNAPVGLPQQSLAVNEKPEMDSPQSPMGGRTDVFDLPFHMARYQIEESLRTKMASTKSRMGQLQDLQKRAEVTSKATERELNSKLNWVKLGALFRSRLQ